jgi:hypothetical protein
MTVASHHAARPGRTRALIPTFGAALISGAAGCVRVTEAPPQHEPGQAVHDRAGDSGAPSEPPPQSCAPLEMSLAQYFPVDSMPTRVPLFKADHGAGLGDLDLDGDLDIFVAWEGGSLVAINDGAGHFTLDDTWTMDGGPLPAATSAYLIDLDADGDLDVWLGTSRDHNDRILYQEAPGQLRSVELEGSSTGSYAGAFADMDNDDDLDLVVSSRPHHMTRDAFVDGTIRGQPNHLYLQHEGAWVRADERLPVEHNWGVTFQAMPMDADNDGDLDIYVVNDAGYQAVPNQLWRNDGGWFVVDEDCSCTVPMYSMGSAFTDWNGDLIPDTYTTNVGPQTLLMSDGPARYVNMGLALNAIIPIEPETFTSWGVAISDYDRDGYDDLYVTFGRLEEDIESAFGTLPGTDPSWEDGSLQHDVLLRALPDGTFAVADTVGLDQSPGRQRSVVQGDLDGDGDTDAVVMGKHDMKIWLTDGGCPTGLRVSVDGPDTNPHGLGSRVRVWSQGRAQTRWLLSDRMHGNDAHEMIFGLGGHARADKVEVRFPDGSTWEATDVPAGDVEAIWSR